MFQNIQNDQASYACITVSGFIFLCDAHCSLQTERKKFLPCYSYTSESLIGLVCNQLESLTDRSTLFPQNCLVKGGGGVGIQIEREIFWRGRICELHRGGGGGMLV